MECMMRVRARGCQLTLNHTIKQINVLVPPIDLDTCECNNPTCLVLCHLHLQRLQPETHATLISPRRYLQEIPKEN